MTPLGVLNRFGFLLELLGVPVTMLLEHLLELMLEHVLVARIGLEQKVVCFGNMFLELF